MQYFRETINQQNVQFLLFSSSVDMIKLEKESDRVLLKELLQLSFWKIIKKFYAFIVCHRLQLTTFIWTMPACSFLFRIVSFAFILLRKTFIMNERENFSAYKQITLWLKIILLNVIYELFLNIHWIYFSEKGQQSMIYIERILPSLATHCVAHYYEIAVLTYCT